ATEPRKSPESRSCPQECSSQGTEHTTPEVQARATVQRTQGHLNAENQTESHPNPISSIIHPTNTPELRPEKANGFLATSYLISIPRAPRVIEATTKLFISTTMKVDQEKYQQWEMGLRKRLEDALYKT